MSEQIDCGDGWRLLRPDELVSGFGDEYKRADGTWIKVPSYPNGEKASKFTAVRRRLPSKPDVLKIESECGSISLEASPLGPARIIQRWEDEVDEVRLDTTEQVRGVIAWLQQVADWREAQNL